MSDCLKKLKERLYANSKKNGECIESTYKARDRYVYTKFNGKTITVHRASWIAHHGEIPKEMWVLHKCDNPPCFNPEHLFLGAPKDNSKDMQLKGRANYWGAIKYTKKQVEEIIKLRDQGMSGKNIAKKLEIPSSSVYQILKRIDHKDNFVPRRGRTKTTAEDRRKAKELRDSGMLCKDIQKLLGVSKRTMTRIFNGLKQ